MAEPSRKPDGIRAAPIKVPRDAEELQRLSHQEIDQLAATTQLRLSHQHHKRSKLLMASKVDAAALAKVGAQIKATGNLLSAVLQRRGQLRSQRRRELGCMPERNAAIAMAVDSRLSSKTWRLVQDEADRILAVAAADLEQADANDPTQRVTP